LTKSIYTRQQARADKRAILGVLRSLGRGDHGPADRIIEMDRRALLTTIAGAALAPALPSFPAAVVPTVPPVRVPMGGDDFFMARSERAAYFRYKEAGDVIGMTVAAAAIRAADVGGDSAYQDAKARGDEPAMQAALADFRRREMAEGKHLGDWAHAATLVAKTNELLKKETI
jgi:hypothetical protein